MLSNKIRRGLVLGLGLIVIFLVLVWMKSFFCAMHYYQKGAVCLESDQYIEGMNYFDRSIHWYAPFNPYVQRSAERLWEISRNAEVLGNTQLALIAVRTIQRGFMSARNLYTPGKEWLRKCEHRVQELLSIQEGRKGNREGGGDGGSKKIVPGSPQVESPDVLWSIILLLGLFGWIGSVLIFILKGFQTNKEGPRLVRLNLKWLGLGVIFLVLWIAGMMQA